MTCYNPVAGFRTPHGVVFSALRRHDILGPIEIACGQCIGCRLRRAQDWALRVMHEAQMHDENCFVTLTYADEHLPAGGSLDYGHFQLFMRRLRRDVKVRFFMCGEYGPATERPHYHACLFGVSFPDQVVAGKSGAGKVFYRSKLLDSYWQLGHATVQPLNPSTAAYTARYVVDKLTGDAGAEAYGERVPPFSHCSLKPGIGARWYERYGGDVLPRDTAVMDGRAMQVPKYYDKLMRRSKDVRMDEVEFQREIRGRKCAADSTPERLAVRETVRKAALRNKRREVC